MDTPPFDQKLIAPGHHFREQAAHFLPLDADTQHDLGFSIRTKQIDFRLLRSRDVNMRGVVIGRVDHEPKPKRPMDDDRSRM